MVYANRQCFRFREIETLTINGYIQTMRLEAEFAELISRPNEIQQICQSAVDNL